MKTITLSILFLFVSSGLFAASAYVVNNSKAITASTSLVILRNPSANTKVARIDAIEISSSAACTFTLIKSPSASVTASSALTIYPLNFKTSAPASTLSGSTTTSGNYGAGTAIYSSYIGAAGTRTLSMGGIVLNPGDSISLEGNGTATVHANILFSE